MNLNKNLFLFAITLLFCYSCTVETIDDDNPTPVGSVEITAVDDNVFIYDQLTIDGRNFSTECSDHTIFLIQGSTETELEVQECASNELKAFVPETTTPGSYTIRYENEDNIIFTLNENPIAVTVKERPVILSISTTTFPVGSGFTVSGLNFNNTSGQDVYDPKVWITKSGYTNTVSEITVNSAGTEAAIVLDDDIPADNYQLKLTAVEWSNELDITIQ